MMRLAIMGAPLEWKNAPGRQRGREKPPQGTRSAYVGSFPTSTACVIISHFAKRRNKPKRTLLTMTPPPALVAALRRVLRPLVRVLVARGITYPMLADILKRTY